MCAKIFQRHFLTFICDYLMHYCHIEQPGSKGEEGMWRGYRRVHLLHLSRAVALNDSVPRTISSYMDPRPPVPHYGPFIQSMNISQARNCWKKSAGRTSGFFAPLGISTQWTFFPTPVNKVQCKFNAT